MFMTRNGGRTENIIHHPIFWLNMDLFQEKNG